MALVHYAPLEVYVCQGCGGDRPLKRLKACLGKDDDVVSEEFLLTRNLAGLRFQR